MRKFCCVVPEKNRKQENVLETEANYKTNFFCQFHNELSAEYERHGEYFCILHLPYPTPQERLKGYKEFDQEKKEAFLKMLSKGVHCFKYINIYSPKIDSKEIPELKEKVEHLSFPGSYIWSLTIQNICEIGVLDLSTTILYGRCCVSCEKIEILSIRDANVFSSMEFKIKSLSCVVIERSIFEYRTDGAKRLFYSNNEVLFEGCEINSFKIIFSKVCSYLSFKNSYLGAFSAMNNKFSHVPDFLSLKGEMHHGCSFPEINDFHLFEHKPIKEINKKYGIKIFSTSTKTLWREYVNIKKRYINSMKLEYKKTIAIYKLTKDNGWYSEQDNYYYLMRRVFEETNIAGSYVKIFSRIYRYLSRYGQSIIKPLLWLVGFYVFFSLIYCFIDYNKYSISSHSFFYPLKANLILSLKQIIKPFQLILSNSCDTIKNLVGVTESIITSTLIAFIIIGLRWNFKRD